MAYTGTHSGYACLPRSVTYALVRSFAFQPTVATLRTRLRRYILPADVSANLRPDEKY